MSARRIDPNYLTNTVEGRKIPLLPGFRMPEPRRTHYGKKQMFTGSSDVGCTRPQSAAAGRPGSGVLGRQRPMSAAIRRPQSAAAAAPKEQPNWLQNDRQVLRFYGYFVEDAFQSPYESQRVRKIILYYYLADSSLHVAEPKIQNSGMPSGVFIKRARISKPDGQMFQPGDFGVGGVVEIRARRFHLVDADSSTRTYYEENFFQQLDKAIDYPQDAHMKLQKEMVNMKAGGAGKGKKPDSRRQFMEFDQKVLRFSCFWDDTKKLYGEKRKFIMNYFLSNDTIEVREVLQPNSGRDPFPMLLRRQVLPCRARAGEIIKPLDLMCGKYLHVYSRDMLMVDCDEFTKNFYRDYFGIDQRPVAGYEPKHRGSNAVPEPPPTGFGSEEDSLQSHYSLNPKPPKRDMKKAQRMDRKVLRFRAKLVNPPIQDIPRRFVIAVYLVDDTVSIFEPPQRNSGIIGGKFLERGKFRHMEPAEGGPPRFFYPHDFYVGARVPLEFAPHQQLEILEADAFTLKYCEGACKQFRKSDIEMVNKNLASALTRSATVNLRDFFMDMDARDNGFIKSGELQSALKTLNAFDRLHIQERITLARRYDDNDDGNFAYHEMCDDLCRALHQLHPVQATSQIESAFNKLRASATSLRKVFRRVDKGDGRLQIEEYLDLLDFYQIEVTESEARAAFASFDHNGNDTVDYNEFCDAMYPCVFEGSGGYGGSGNGNGNDLAWQTAAQGGPAVTDTKKLVQRWFKGKKYQLHKQFKKRDLDHCGKADEDMFIEALDAVNPNVDDDTKYELALAFFPEAGEQIDYSKWIEAQFKN